MLLLVHDGPLVGQLGGLEHIFCPSGFILVSLGSLWLRLGPSWAPSGSTRPPLRHLEQSFLEFIVQIGRQVRTAEGGEGAVLKTVSLINNENKQRNRKSEKNPKTKSRLVIYNGFSFLQKSDNDPRVNTHIMV